MAHDPSQITRRDLLRGATFVGTTAAAMPANLVTTSLVTTTDVASAAESLPAPAPIAREAFENLTAAESDLLETIVERLIPSDASGPGAKEARVAHYIDRALGGALAPSRSAYASGLESLDRYARASRGKSFLQLPSSDQDSVLIDCETGSATGFTGSSAQFFGMLLNHARQGMFGDPYYGGNAKFAGWDLIGYPGVRTSVSASDQRSLEANELKSIHKSAYDYGGFNKATARTDSHDTQLIAGVTKHGD